MKSFAALRIISISALLTVISGCDGGFFLSGNVVDSEGKPIPGATFQATSSESPENFEAVADKNGCLSVGSTLAPGEYNFTVIVRATGYKDLQTSMPTLEFHRLRIVLAKQSQAFVSQAQVLNDNEFGQVSGGI